MAIFQDFRGGRERVGESRSHWRPSHSDFDSKVKRGFLKVIGKHSPSRKIKKT